MKYNLTFPNINFAINCNNPVRFLFAQGVNSQCSTQRSGLEWHEETEQFQKNCGKVSKLLQETYLQSYSTDKK